ncbi:MAG: UDP-N-acetylmuramate dehydrogenase [Gammaproteobacteria bacterium]|nr:UDP-N-acetylmuramate dehydrogenase [Gammaproteobacteria bacterium]
MMAAQKNVLRGVIKYHEPMARHTSWRTGGPADRYYEPADLADLCEFLQQTPASEPVMFVGLGSNLLVRDGGIRGTVIMTSGLLNEISLLEPGLVRVEAGIACAKVARFCARQGLVGVEFLAGIPGTMGGALAMNAGAFGGETWPHVVALETIDRSGARHQRAPAEYDISYRHVRGPAGEWFVAAHLRLQPGDTEASTAHIKSLLEKRSATQPIGLPSCGSVFRNPPGDHAARLIEISGLKGTRIGGAIVSEKHANFIINTGTATAADIEALIEKVAAEIEQRHGIRLVKEVHIVGEAK